MTDCRHLSLTDIDFYLDYYPSLIVTVIFSPEIPQVPKVKAKCTPPPCSTSLLWAASSTTQESNVPFPKIAHAVTNLLVSRSLV